MYASISAGSGWPLVADADVSQGFSIGLAQCCINVYISEMAPTAGRGALMSLVQLFVSAILLLCSSGLRENVA